MSERLQKIIAAAGICSRRGAEALIERGAVTVNGVRACVGQSAEPGCDDIRVNGKPIGGTRRQVYIMLNKPRGYVTTLSDERDRKTVAELISDCGERVYPCGRLDMATEGLLILTNDGAVAQRLTHPSRGVTKTYRASVRLPREVPARDGGKRIADGERRDVSARDGGGSLIDRVERLRRPFELDGYKTRSAEVQILSRGEDSAIVSVTISEGRNRQIRRMCELAGLEVTRLVRISEGELSLGGLKPGRWRYLTDDELKWIVR